MDYREINWDEVPDVISKELFRKLCHVSKRTAKYLLDSGKVPCKSTKQATHKYKITKTDVMEYMEKRKYFPEFYAPPSAYRMFTTRSRNLSMKADMTDFYTDLLKDQPDVLTSKEISSIIEYQPHTINSWYLKGLLKGFKKSGALHVPKIYLIEFLNSTYFKTILQKSKWHQMALETYMKRPKYHV